MTIVNIICEPNTPPLTLAEFKKTAAPHTLALDGSVNAPPMYDRIRKIGVLDHHSGVFRSSTYCTCNQAVNGIRSQDLVESFINKDGVPEFNLLINDADEDICATIYVFRNLEMVQNHTNPIFNKFLEYVNLMDVTAGTYPFPKHSKLLRELAWVFEPYRNARLNGLLNKKDPSILLGIIDDVCLRIDAYVNGDGKELPLDTRYAVLERYPNWSMVQEIGLHARTGMFSDGIRTYLSVSERPNGRYNYVIGTPAFSTFDLSKIFKALNKAEGCETDCWGGSDTIGGSPRVGGSGLLPSEVAAIINKCYAATQKAIDKAAADHAKRMAGKSTGKEPASV